MAKKISVSLEKEHIKAVKDFGRKLGIRQFSTALQAMIHHFQQLQAQPEPAIEAPAQPAQNGNGAT